MPRGAFFPGLKFEGISSSKDAYISKDLCYEVIFLERARSVDFKLDCRPKELMQEIFELRLPGIFPSITIVLSIFVSFLNQWVHVNAFSMC